MDCLADLVALQNVFRGKIMNSVLRPVGPVVNPLPPRLIPDLSRISGRYVDLVAVDVKQHGAGLFGSFVNTDPDGAMWTYMPYGPFVSEITFVEWLTAKAELRDPWFYTIVDKASGQPLGMCSFMRADPVNGAIEIGNIWFSPMLQKSRMATEAIFLMMQYCFDELKVRRLEWKCDALNAPSRKAAARFGFTFEGIFRQHYIIKGRNRDTAWFSIIDQEWLPTRAGFELWLAPSNFDGQGYQKAKLILR
jgi:RimJ/RimL family protein N-acetyltransferase